MDSMVRSAALTGYSDVARSLGIDPDRLIAAVGLPAEALLDPERRIPVSAVRRLLELSASAAGVEDFGLRMAETRDPSNLGLLAAVAREAPTLRAGIAALSRYMILHNESLSVRMDRMDGDWLVVVNRRDNTARQVVEMSTGVLHRTLCGLFAADWNPQLVCFAHSAPRDSSTHRRVFEAPVQFDAAVSGLVCGDAEMNRHRLDRRPESLLARDARNYLEKLLAERELPLPDRVREVIVRILPEGGCTVDAVAEQLGMDRRTLHRHLSRTKHTYAGIVDEVRQDAARRMVAEHRRPLQAVAGTLGFDSPSVLSRWFRQRFGCTATEWRRRIK